MAKKAKESSHVKKVRQKLRRQLRDKDRQVNEEALRNMRQIIQRQIARHQSERVDLKAREITLFDENQHSAKTQNKFILNLLKKLKHPLP